MFYDIAKQDGKNDVRLPVKFRYRSPVIFEFHTTGKRGAAAYAVIWLHHLVDNEPTPIDIPIWTTKNSQRLLQNYLTEESVRAGVLGLEDLQEVGRLQFRCQFKAGTDESHREFVIDSDSRETFETWEACYAEGVRGRKVEPELSPTVQRLHEKSLTEGRDVLEQADPREKQKWLAKDGQDWSGAFGQDPKAYMDSSRRKRAEPGRDKPVHDPINPSSDDDDIPDNDISDSDSDNLGIQDATHQATTNGLAHPEQANGTDEQPLDKQAMDKANKRTEKRKQRGLMQWKPVRNLAFAKDEMKFGLKKVQKKITGGLEGREPGVETEV